MSGFLQRAFERPAEWQTLLLGIVPALVLAWLAARLVRRLAARGLGVVLGDTLTTASPAVRGPLRLVWAAVFLLVFALVTVPLLELAGLRPRTGVRLRTLADWVFGHGLRIVLISVLAYALIRTVTLLIRRFEHEINLGTGLDALERAKRAKTLGSVVRNFSTALVSSVAILMILRELDLDIAPVLASAGVLGLAVGFGAQTLVRDIISGFFLILEDQLRVGDVAAINGQGASSKRSTCARSSCATGKGPCTCFPTAPSRRWPTAARTFPTTSSTWASPTRRIRTASWGCCGRSAPDFKPTITSDR